MGAEGAVGAEGGSGGRGGSTHQTSGVEGGVVRVLFLPTTYSSVLGGGGRSVAARM